MDASVREQRTSALMETGIAFFIERPCETAAGQSRSEASPCT